VPIYLRPVVGGSKTVKLYTFAADAGGGGATINADLAATEAQDVAAFAAQLVHVATLAVSEAQDTAAFSASLVHQTALAAVEARDVAAFSGALVHVADLAATEAQDIASFEASVESAQADIERGAKWIRKAAKEQRYIYYRAREVPARAAEAIERVVEHFEDAPTPSLTDAVALLALELEERGVDPVQAYTDLLREELARLRQAQIIDDDDEINAAIVALL